MQAEVKEIKDGIDEERKEMHLGFEVFTAVTLKFVL
jgi:hypothetical protein